MGKRIVRIIFSLAAVVVSYAMVAEVFVPKKPGGTVPLFYYYEQPENTIDVLFMGSSQTGWSFDPAVFWEKYGISSYSLWASGQPFWNTYYYIKEALKTQSPKVIVVDLLYASMLDDYSTYIVHSLGGMKQNINRFKATIVTTPPEERINYLLGMPIYHNRISELNAFDYFQFSDRNFMKNFKGYFLHKKIKEYPVLDASEMPEETEMNQKEETYLRKIIELCQEQGIDLLFVKTPAPNSQMIPYVNYATGIAEEYGVPFINYLKVADRIDFQPNDFSVYQHTNCRGAKKTSSDIADYLHEHYDLPDHRGDSAYSSWDENSFNTQNDYLTFALTDQEFYREAVRNGNKVFILKKGPTDIPESLYLDLEQVGVDTAPLRSEDYAALMLTEGDKSIISKNIYQGGLMAEFSDDETYFYAEFYSGLRVNLSGEVVVDHAIENGLYVFTVSPQHGAFNLSLYSEDTNYQRESTQLQRDAGFPQ